MSCVLVTFSPNKFTFSLLFSRKRTNLCVIFTALFISELLKMWERSVSLAWFQALWNEMQSSWKLITRKVQANVGELRGWKVSFWGGIRWAERVGHLSSWWKQSFTRWAAERLGLSTWQIVTRAGEVNLGNTVLASKLWNMQRNWKAAYSKYATCYLCHDLSTELIVRKFIQSQRIPRTENSWDSAGYPFHSDSCLWLEDISEEVGLKKCWGG